MFVGILYFLQYFLHKQETIRSSPVYRRASYGFLSSLIYSCCKLKLKKKRFEVFDLFRLKPLDILVMKHLDKCVNVIPVIAKADTLTLEEREAFKCRVIILKSFLFGKWLF